MPLISRLYPHRFSRPLFPRLDIEEILLACTGDIRIFVEESDFPPSSHYFPKGITELSIPLRELMLCSGLMQSSASHPMSPSAWGFLLEHYESLALRPGILRYSSHASDWDPRVKQIFSERLSCGIAAWCLWNIDSIVHIADACEFIGKSGTGPYAGKSLSGLKLYGKNGKLKPDFFCITSKSECVIVECKGAMGPPSALSSDIAKGKLQVSNVKPVGVSVREKSGQLVFATNIRGEAEAPRTGCDSTLNVVDPEFAEDAIRTEVTSDRIAFMSYGKLLSFSGRQDIYLSLKDGYRFPDDEVIRRERQLKSRTKFITISETENFIYGLETHTALELLSRPLEGLSRRISETTANQIERSREPEDSSIELPNGFIVIPKIPANLDALERVR